MYTPSALRSATVRALRVGSAALGAFALGALATGALATGAVAVLVVRQLRVRDGRLGVVEIDDLVVTRLHVRELVVTDAALLPNLGDDVASGTAARS